MKILFCTNVYQVIENGPVKFARMLPDINHLYPEHEIRILTEDINHPSEEVYKVTMKSGWQKSILSQFIRMGRYHRQAMKIRKEFPFDVLVYNNAFVGLFSAIFFTRTVVMINDDNNLNFSELPILSRNWIKRLIFRNLEKLTASFARTVIANSDYLRTRIIAEYRINAEKVSRLYKGVKEQPVVPDRPFAPENMVRILFVKNDFQRGGLYTLTEALALTGLIFQVTVAGNNAADHVQIGNLLNHPNIVKSAILGKQTQEQIFGLMTQSDIFCVPSYKEAFGVANLEALSLGLSVVTTRVGGVPEALNNENCAWLVPPGNAQELAAALVDCIKNDVLREVKIKNGLQHVKSFSEKKLLRNFISILSETAP
ncbi:D-inositol-3-phosphate glycosyltransferase [Dyadobacter sp. CECT 9275]|uniref:D-inositol-3-phosphate glycosyltransferase n=1 Tax=Dyadobacter helix TaxID=2822344 RepID=A0A916JFG5_9BACT|nr:glycosyltransferase family 4 protein [Dyadobacter sp. CECT 9275]CAG5008025.1 D-inositol-3-phosphate glycosyltransferase [Dyadobacter sp. CECT 9275]